MDNERHKAQDSDEIIWLRLNRLKSTKLCEKLIFQKNQDEPNPNLTEGIIKEKAIGLSSAIQSAIGYWQTNSQSLNARILSRYYFLLQLTIAEQVGSVKNSDTLKDVQRHTEMGHGLGTISGPDGDFPDNYFVFLLQSGHFNNYGKSQSIDLNRWALAKRPRKFDEVTEKDKLTSLTDLFRRVPELSNVIQEYLNKPPLAFHVGYNLSSNPHKQEEMRRSLVPTLATVPPQETENFTMITIHQKNVDLAYLRSLSMPFTELSELEDTRTGTKSIVGKLHHPTDVYWHQKLQTYGSSYATMTYSTPLWREHYDSILVNYALLYSLSILVRYLPDMWYRVSFGDLNHIGSLIEYYISIMDHVLPLQMLERITGARISVDMPGSFFGQI